MMACLVAFREEAADEALLALARSGLAVEPLGPEAAYEVAELRALGNAEGEEVVAVEVGAFVTGFREVVEDAVADGWIFREGSEGPECREQEGREDFGEGAALERGSSELRSEAPEAGHGAECFALRFGYAKAARKVQGLGLGQVPGEYRRVGSAGAGRIQLAQAGEGGGVLGFEVKGWVDGGEGAQIVEIPERALGLILSEHAGEFAMDAGAADGLEVREVALEPCERVRLDLEAEAGGVADGAEDAGGVVPKGALVEDADEARVEVRAATGQVEDLAGFGAAQAECEGVDGEVAAEEVFSDRGGLDGGEGAWADIRLGAGGDQVDVEAREADRSRKEGRVDNRTAADCLGELAG